ncbi:hypothetical protein Ddye_011228 [Dipteronia dyeriana]|uniref:Uncharacterized protein n=1 Tax=Dipteronia dyeriana TaxID=168575 RepID=A0AAD9UBZ7_9ROSI|nr:hypothetical protein Ddye_011228 [Dipteronia dyeriana]
MSNVRDFCLAVKEHGMKIRSSKYRLSWILEEDISKVIDMGTTWALISMIRKFGWLMSLQKRFRRLLVGQSASLATCYALCFVPCVIAEGSAAKCALICVRKCLVKPSSIDLQKDTHHSYFCKVGCATSLCTNLSTKEDPAVEKVEGCVNTCSETCTQK